MPKIRALEADELTWEPQPRSAAFTLLRTKRLHRALSKRRAKTERPAEQKEVLLGPLLRAISSLRLGFYTDARGSAGGRPVRGLCLGWGDRRGALAAGPEERLRVPALHPAPSPACPAASHAPSSGW